ncbi:MAG: hypothetical protein IKX55_04825 [Bacteroidaceae bacterium]|nr:hypothetical protein [Bacteroidaceae bacterium]
MKRFLFFLVATSLVAFTACDDNENVEDNSTTTGGSVYGTWVNDLARESADQLVINENGTGTLYRETFTFTYDDKVDSIHIENIYDGGVKEITSYKVSFLGDVMTWSYTEEEMGHVFYEVWYKEGGNFGRKVSDARYDLFTDASAEDTMAVYIFKGNKVDVYIIAWGQHLSGTFTHENGVLSMNITEGKCLSSESDHRSWFAPGLDPETLEPFGGYEWYNMASLDDWTMQSYNQTKDMLSKVTFVLTSDNNGYGSTGRSGMIKKH